MAEPGNRLISADYSQVELRLLAHIADEPVLKDIFRRGEDVHTATAEAILGGKTDPGTRSKAKMVNYGIVYGLSAFGLADRLQIEKEEAQEFIDAYLERFPKVKQFIESTIERAREEGHVATLFGRIRRVPELRSRQFQTRSLGERLAVNMVIQGTAADIIKVAMVRAPRRAAQRRPRAPGSCSRSTTSCCSRARRTRSSAATEIVRARDGRRVRDGPAARGRRGRRRELARGQVMDKEVAVAGDRRRGRPGRRAGADQRRAGTDDRQPRRPASVSFVDRAWRLLVLITFVWSPAGSASAGDAIGSLSWYYSHSAAPLGAVDRDVTVADHGARSWARAA